jgi:hypothetical protein
MKKIALILMTFLSFFYFLSCKNESFVKSESPGIYIISKQDSIMKANEKVNKIPPPRIPQERKWYTDLVFIMDSKNKVYIYQTEIKVPSENVHFEYPNYIGLRPEYLVTIDSDHFISFLKNNNDIFGVFPNDKKIWTAFYVASESDTIKNKALFKLCKELDKTKSRSFYIVRKTTEEENKVLVYKRNNREFEPKSIDWSKKFYNGNTKPFSKEYDEVEKKMNRIVLAKQTYKKVEMKIEM